MHRYGTGMGSPRYMEYGQEQEVVNAVNRELKILKSDTCSTAEYIVKLRNFLPGLEEAWKKL